MLKLIPIAGAESRVSPASVGERHELPSGAAVELRATPDGEEGIRVHGPQGELVLEYDPHSKKTRIGIPAGDLELACEGNVEINAAGGLSLRGHQRIDLVAGRRDGAGQSRLDLSPAGLVGHVHRLEVVARQADFFCERTRVAGERLRAKIAEVRLTSERLESSCETLRSQAQNVYQKVEGVLHTKAGRLRTMVTDAVQLKARMLFLKADADAKIKGEKIYLG